MKLKALTIHFIILFLYQNIIVAQEKESLNDKIKSIKGDVEKISIKTSEG